MRISRWMTGIAGLVAALGLASGAAAAVPAANGGNSDEARVEHQRIVDFWTPERVARAVPRDFAFNPDTGSFVPRAKPSKPGPTTDLEPIWKGEVFGTVGTTTGKVLFQMGSSYYVCSASVVQDKKADLSVVLTAAHCVYDETAGGFAKNWMFIPSYDAADPGLTLDKTFCTARTTAAGPRPPWWSTTTTQLPGDSTHRPPNTTSRSRCSVTVGMGLSRVTISRCSLTKRSALRPSRSATSPRA